MAHKGIPKLVAPCTVYYYTVHCTTVYMSKALAYLRSSLLFPFKCENVPIVPA